MPSASSVDRLDSLPDGVVVADGHGIVVDINAEARTMLGVAGPGGSLREVMRLQDTNGCDWWAAVQPYDGLATRTRLTENSWLLPDGTEVLVTGRLVREGRAGAVREIGLVLRSGRGRERLDRERSDLVATVAHELRSPLTGLRGFVTTLIAKWDLLKDDQKLLLLQTVNNDAERLGRLIIELLDVARIDTGRLPLHPRVVDLGSVVLRTLASVGQTTNRELLAELPDDPATFLADPDKVTQVITNLVENAVRHGEGTVTVRVVPGRDSVDLVVDDEGEGIEEAIRRRVFTKFWKQRSSPGSGLGMYIVHGLVAAHGGTVVIGTSPAGGARVTVTWPLG